MIALVGTLLLLALSAPGGVAAATKDEPPADREIRKMMDFLRQMEMIRQMEMLRDMDHLEDPRDPKTTAPGKTAPVKKKETVK